DREQRRGDGDGYEEQVQALVREVHDGGKQHRSDGSRSTQAPVVRLIPVPDTDADVGCQQRAEIQNLQAQFAQDVLHEEGERAIRYEVEQQVAEVRVDEAAGQQRGVLPALGDVIRA